MTHPMLMSMPGVNGMLAVGESSMLRHFVIDGGPITWFVLIPLSVITLAMALHYMIAIRRGTQAPAGLARALVATARQGQVRSLVELTREDDSMLGRAAFAAASNVGAGREAATTAVDEALETHASKQMRRIEYLNVIGNVSPMIGLLGTVVGMIQAFNRIYSMRGGVPDATQLIGDISIALVNTFWGLFIAIPGLSAYAFLRNRIDAYAAESMKLCDGMISMLAEPGPAEASRPAEKLTL